MSYSYDCFHFYFKDFVAKFVKTGALIARFRYSLSSLLKACSLETIEGRILKFGKYLEFDILISNSKKKFEVSPKKCWCYDLTPGEV